MHLLSLARRDHLDFGDRVRTNRDIKHDPAPAESRRYINAPQRYLGIVARSIASLSVCTRPPRGVHTTSPRELRQFRRRSSVG